MWCSNTCTHSGKSRMSLESFGSQTLVEKSKSTILLLFVTFISNFQYKSISTKFNKSEKDIIALSACALPHTLRNRSLLEHGLECMMDMGECGPVRWDPQPTLLHQFVHSYWTTLRTVHSGKFEVWLKRRYI